MTMSLQEVRDYLYDNTDFTDSELTELAYEIHGRLDPTPMHEQIDELLRQFEYAEDYECTIRN